jgi:hypothetical protein
MASESKGRLAGFIGYSQGFEGDIPGDAGSRRLTLTRMTGDEFVK